MKRLTITEAVVEVLETTSKAMTTAEIAAGIKERRLHPLPTLYPTSVVNRAIRRPSLDAEEMAFTPVI